MKKWVAATGASDFLLNYFRTCTKSRKNTPLYGVYVEKVKDGQVLETEDSGAISPDMAYVDGVIKILAKNTVTPMSVCEVLDEVLSYYEPEVLFAMNAKN